jgi:hypothetical protein
MVFYDTTENRQTSLSRTFIMTKHMCHNFINYVYAYKFTCNRYIARMKSMNERGSMG